MKIKDQGISSQNQTHSQKHNKKDSNHEKSQEGFSKQASFSNVPSFLLKTYDIVNDPSCDNMICWNEKGDGFIVRQPNEFAEKILPKYFKHNNFASFVRQLNMYDFHKTKNNSNHHCFTHHLFIKGQKHLLTEIKRKNAQNEKIGGAMPQQQIPMGQYRNQVPNDGSYPSETQSVAGHMKMEESYGRPLQDPYMQKVQLVQAPSMFDTQSMNFQHMMMNISQRQQEQEEKIKIIEQKNKEYAQRNNLLWQELCKSREREQNLERLLIITVTWLATMNGISFFSNNRGLSFDQNSSTSQRNSSTIPTGSSTGDQIVLRNDAESQNIQNFFKKFIQEMIKGSQHSNSIFNVINQQSAGNTSTNASDIFPPGLNNTQMTPIYQQQLFEQLAKGLSQIANQSSSYDIKNLASMGTGNAANFEPEVFNSHPRGATTVIDDDAPSFNYPMNPPMHSQPKSTYQNQPYHPYPKYPQQYNSSIALPQGQGMFTSNSPGNMSPNPYNFDDLDKNSFRNIFGKTLSEFSCDIGNPVKRGSRANSIAASSQAGDDASLYIAKEPAPSEADSDAQRKRLSSALKKEFEFYDPQVPPSDSQLTSNHNVEFETISSSSDIHLGKRKTEESHEKFSDEPSIEKRRRKK